MTGSGSVETFDATTADSLLVAIAAAPAASPGPQPGDVIDDIYRIVRKLGAGGMGAVYLARDRRLERDVAVKLHLASADDAVARAQREARVLARLAHPNVVAIHDVGTAAGRLYIAMEYIEGETLSAWLARPDYDWRAVVAVMQQAGAGLGAAHAAGLIHRDFKPDNVLVARSGRVVVVDFGLARDAGATAEPAAMAPDVDGSATPAALTQDGARVGTRGYMSPEQRRGEPLDARSDQYAFGLVFAAGVATRRPPTWLTQALARSTALDPDARWPSLAALLAFIDARRRRPRRIGVAIALTSAVAAAAVVPLALAGDPASARCTGGATRIAAVWHPTRAAHLRATLDGRGVPSPAIASVIATFDRFAADWRRDERTACLAGQVRRERAAPTFIAQTVCYQAVAARLAAAIDALEAASPTAPHVLDVAAALPTLAACDDLRQLSVLQPLPADAADAIVRLDRAVADVDAAYLAGRRDETRAVALALPAQARTLNYPPLTAAALITAARSLGGSDNPGARAAATEALQLALASGADATALAAARELAWSHHLAGDGTAALEALDLAAALATRVDDSVATRHRLTSDRALVLRDLGRLDEAEAAARDAIALAHDGFGDDALATATARATLGIILYARGDLEASATALQRSLAVHEALLGPDHPDTWEVLLLLSALADRAGDPAQALAHAREVAARMDRAGVTEQLLRARVLLAQAVPLVELGDADAGIAVAQQAVALGDRAPAPDLSWQAVALGNLAITEAGVGRLDDAITAARASLARFERASTSDPSALIAPHQLLGTLLRMTGALTESAQQLRAAVAIGSRSAAIDRPERVNAEVELAMTELALGQADAAAARLAAVMPILERPDGNPMNLAEARFARARATWDARGDRPAAIAWARQARDSYATLGDGYAAPRAEVEAWLATHRRR